MELANGMKFGLGEYAKSGLMKTFNQVRNKSTFGKSNDPESFKAGAFFILLVITIITLVFGFIAVSKICPGNSERAKNIRLGLYAILLLTEGGVGWIYIAIWLLNINLNNSLL